MNVVYWVLNLGEMNMPKRLIYWSSALVLYLAICLIVYAVAHRTTLQLSAYTTMVSAIPGRIHEPMSRYEIDHLAAQVEKIEFGGDLRDLGLNYQAKPLSDYLGDDKFDLTSSLELLLDGRLRPSQVKFDSLSSKVSRVYSKRIQLLNRLGLLALFAGLLLLGILLWLWFQSRRHWSREIIVPEDESLPLNSTVSGNTPQLSFDDYLKSVVAEEVKFVGNRAVVQSNGFDSIDLSKTVSELIEFTAEQLVRNSVEHGGRSAEQRVLSGKTDYLSIRATLRDEEESVVLSVWDNGEGLDSDVILAKALELGLISHSTAKSITPEQSIKLVFLSGFSTRDRTVSSSDADMTLSDLRNLLKKHKGLISVQNQRGIACQFSVRFPKD